MKKKIFLTVILIIIVSIITGAVIKSQKSEVSYRLQPAKKRDITQVVEASGTINPVNTVSVGSTVSGLISGLYADFNSKVKKGQLLAEIDPRTFQATVDQNQASLYNAKATLLERQAKLELDKKMYDRYKKLYEKQYVPLSEVDQAESDYKASLAQVEAAKYQIEKAQAVYNSSLVNLGYTKITAPVDGIIISRDIDMGQPVAATLNAPELFTIAQDIEKMQIEVAVSEADIGKVKEGQTAKYVLDGYPNDVFYGKVTQVRIDSTTTSNVVTYTVIVSVDNSELKIKPGMTANVSIIVSESKDVLAVPNFALKFSPPENTKRYEKQGLWIKEKGKLVRKEVVTGASDDTYTEIKSGIKEGDLVATGNKNPVKSSKNSGRPPRMF